MDLVVGGVHIGQRHGRRLRDRTGTLVVSTIVHIGAPAALQRNGQGSVVEGRCTTHRGVGVSSASDQTQVCSRHWRKGGNPVIAQILHIPAGEITGLEIAVGHARLRWHGRQSGRQGHQTSAQPMTTALGKGPPDCLFHAEFSFKNNAPHKKRAKPSPGGQAAKKTSKGNEGERRCQPARAC